MSDSRASSSVLKISTDLLIVFVRFPEPGRVKTRLIPALGEQGAARLQREMTRFILREARALPSNVTVEVFFDGGDESNMQRVFGNDVSYIRQSEGNLGRRMYEAFCSGFARGAQRVLLIGSDCPSLTASDLIEAFEKLKKHSCVLGPAEDGGYYCIGLNQVEPLLFSGIAWGTGVVLRQTLAAVKQAGISLALLQKLSDIDKKEDLPRWEEAVTRAKPRIAVIIPTVNEESSLVDTLEKVRNSENIECVVVDGGSADRTREITVSHGAHVITSDRGRAAQMNAGASYVYADILLFLHADTMLPVGFETKIRRTLADPRMIAGAFSLHFDRDSFQMKIIEFGANIRSKIFRLPYGDQGIFMWAADFRTAGGFPEIPIMEDVELIRNLGKHGAIKILSDRVVTSARRYGQLGVISAWFINQCLLLSYVAGADSDSLAELYRNQNGVCRWSKLLAGHIIKKLSFVTDGLGR